MRGVRKTGCGILVGEAGERFEGAVEEGRDFIESKKSVLREAFDAGREAMAGARAVHQGESRVERAYEVVIGVEVHAQLRTQSNYSARAGLRLAGPPIPRHALSAWGCPEACR